MKCGSNEIAVGLLKPGNYGGVKIRFHSLAVKSAWLGLASVPNLISDVITVACLSCGFIGLQLAGRESLSHHKKTEL